MVDIVEKKNENLAKWAVKFHGMKVGSPAIANGEFGFVKSWNFKFPRQYVEVEMFDTGTSHKFDPKNVENFYPDE